MKTETRQELKKYMYKNHGLVLITADMEAIEDIILKDFTERFISHVESKARLPNGEVDGFKVIMLNYMVKLIETT